MQWHTCGVTPQFVQALAKSFESEGHMFNRHIYAIPMRLFKSAEFVPEILVTEIFLTFYVLISLQVVFKGCMKPGVASGAAGGTAIDGT